MLSKAHDESHCEAVATYAGVTAKALMEGKGCLAEAGRARALAEITGYMHDIRREPTETIPHGQLSAAEFSQICIEKPWKSIPREERDIIDTVIYEHEGSFSDILRFFGDPLDGVAMPSVVAHGIVTADKALEASGYRVVERRALFVGKERTRDGDLKDIFTYPDESDLSVLGETIVRLYGRNPIDSYPDWLKPFAQKWHAVQYRLYRGLLDYHGMDEVGAVKFLVERRFPKIGTVTETARSQRHLDGNFFSSEQYPVLHREIEKLRSMGRVERVELANCSHDVVMVIATAETPEDAIANYRETRDVDGQAYPKPYRYFFDGIIAYRGGSADFAQRFEDSVRSGVEKVVR